MASELTLLVGTAAVVGFLHTLLGPDHYVPFAAMSRALGWSRARTVRVTLLCGLAHVLSSVLLGTVGIALGLAVSRLEAWESRRGEFAAWLLIAFGLVYFAWGLRQAYRNRPHAHPHAHADGVVHSHTHVHQHDHAHAHEPAAGRSRVARVTPWVLFSIFIFGPCEPLIPILMYPAAQKSAWGVMLVTAVFGAVTLATMLVLVMAILNGAARLRVATLERFTHALAGAALLLCGCAVQFLGI
jgi:ABC-type nickel/cobalt efflux system permease component RcnA